MQEIVGNLWDHLGTAIVAVTTCGAVDRRGRAILLRGCGKQARERFPDLPERLGRLLQAGGNHVHDLGDGLVSFPVEEDPYEIPGLGLIERSCCELVTLVNARGWSEIVVPRPGCGGGGLAWNDVRPLLERHFDDRFRIISAG